MSDIRKLKDGDVMRYSKGLLGGKWKKAYAVLFSDSRLCIFDEKGDRRPKTSIMLRDVVPYICVGLLCDRMPVRRPSLPDGYSVHHLVGIGMDPRADTVYWVLFSSDANFEGWMTEIMKTLPRPNPPQQPGTLPQTGTPTGGYVPPPKYPDAPPGVQQAAGYPPQTVPQQPPPYPGGPQAGYPPQPGYPQAGYAQGGYPPQGGYPQGRPAYPQQGGYGAPAQPTVVVVDRGQQGYGGGSSFGGGSGLGMGAAGLGGGLLLGSLAGYGLGSFFGGHSYGGYGGGFGGGYGMGGGYGGMGGGSYYSDNDTTTINNYYNNDGGNTGSGAVQPDTSNVGGNEPVGDGVQYPANDYGGGDFGGYGGGAGTVEETNEEEESQEESEDESSEDSGSEDSASEGDVGGYDGGDYGGGDFGGGDFGGGDFGGGDFGGGDFGGGDF